MRVRAGGAVLGLCAVLGFQETAAAFEDVEVGAIVRHEVPAEGHPGVWMAIDRDLRMDGVGNYSSFEHLIARSFDPEWGAARFRPFVRSYWSENQSVRVIHARIWHGPGRFEDLPPEAVRYRTAAAAESVAIYDRMREVVVDFPPLDPGATVEIRLETAERVRPGELSSRWFENFWGDEDPVIEQQLELIIPTALEPAIVTLGPEVPLRRKKLGGYKSLQWITGNLEARAPLAHGPTSRSPIATAVLPESTSTTLFSTTTWPFASVYLGRFWRARADSTTTDISVTVGRILSSVAEPRERARAIERYVQEEVRTLDIPHQIAGMLPLSAAEIFGARAGAPRDKALLLLTLLRTAGLDARPYMVQSRGGGWSIDAACPDQFDRFLLQVRLKKGEEIWCDPIESRSYLPEGQAFLICIATEEEPPLAPFPGRARAD